MASPAPKTRLSIEMRRERTDGVTEAASARRMRTATLLAGFVIALTGTSTANAGLLTTGPAQTCDTAASQPFQQWGDHAQYVLVGGGSFENGSPAWTLRSGAAVVSGNEPFYVRARTDTRSLRLPAGSSGVSPTTCFVFGDWHIRFFVRNVGAASGRLNVDVIVRSLLGTLSILDGGTIAAGSVWAPSPRVRLTVANVTSLAGTKAVAFRFRPVGTGAAFQIDDVHLDPWKFW